MVAKSPDAFRTISEVAEDLDLPQHVLRFWETRFAQIKPLKRGGGRRYYRPDDVDLLRGIRYLLYGEGYTIRGVQRILKEQGPRFVIAAGRGEFDGIPGRREDGDGQAAGPIPAKRGGHRLEPVFAAGPAGSGPVHEFDVDREDHDPDEEPDIGHGPIDGDDLPEIAERFAARRPPPVGDRLGHEDLDRLKATLAELIELKRLLDQAR